MDPFSLWLGVGLVATGVAIVVFVRFRVRFRKRQVERARDGLQRAHALLQDVEASSGSFVLKGEYLPERVRQPFDAKLIDLIERDLPRIAKVARRARDSAMRDEVGGVFR